MAIVVPNPNVLLDGLEDKVGHVLHEIRTRLLATGLWRVRGSGTGTLSTPTLDAHSAVQLMGQTAGIGGSYDLFQTATWLPFIEYNVVPTWYHGGANSWSRAAAWIVLEEIASGRCLILQRRNTSVDSSGAWLIRFCPHGVASSGATPILPPAALGSEVSSSFNEGLDASPSDFQRSTSQLWFQMGVANAPMAGNVCPFWMAVYNRTAGRTVWGMLYESLADAPAGDLHPYVIGARSWANSNMFFNILLTTQYNVPLVYGGSDCGGRQLSGVNVGTTEYPNSTATTVQPIGPDGYWRAQAPCAYTAAGNANVFVGRCQNILMHPINRNYPSTYNVATPEARLALGQVLVPWAQGVAPGWTP